MSNHPPQDSDLVAWTDPELLWHGGHLAMGWNFTVPVTVGQPGQPDWRFCRKCSVLYFAGEGFDGKCSRGGAHSPAGLNFTMAFEPTSVEGQHQWHRCKKCSILFYWEDEGDPLTSGSCPAGGTHVRVDWRYVLPVTEAGSDGQPDWRFCANCHGLFWDGAASKGICSGAGGGGIHLHGVLDRDGKVFDPFTGPEPIGYLGRDETPNGAFSFDGTMYVFAGFPEPQYSHRNRGGEPLGGEYLFSKRDPSVPARYKLEFRLSPKLGWCTLDAARTTVDAHFVMGFRFVVSHSIAPSVSRFHWLAVLQQVPGHLFLRVPGRVLVRGRSCSGRLHGLRLRDR